MPTRIRSNLLQFRVVVLDGKPAVTIMVRVKREAELLEVVRAGSSIAAPITRLLQIGQQQAHGDHNNSDHHEHFDPSKAPTMQSCIFLLIAARQNVGGSFHSHRDPIV